MSIISHASSELEAQRESLSRLADVLPARVFQHLPFQLPVAKVTPDIQNAEWMAAWSYFGETFMCSNPEQFKELSRPGPFQHRLQSNIDSLEARTRTDAEEDDLSRSRQILRELQGAGNQKRIELYARFLGYETFEEFKEILAKVNQVCHARGAFSLVTLVIPGAYFSNRVAEPSIAALFEGRMAAYKGALSDLPPFWVDAAILSLQDRVEDFRIEAIDNFLLVLERVSPSQVLARNVGAQYEETGSRMFSRRASCPDRKRFQVVAAELVRHHFGDVEPVWMEG